MADSSLQSLSHRSLNPIALRRYAILAALLLVGVVAYFIATGKVDRLLFLPVAAALVWVITSPRMAVYQFVFFLFVSIPVIREPFLGIAEISAGLLIMAALLDFLLRQPEPAPFPRFALNYFVYIGALVVTAVFAHDPTLAIHPIARATLALMTLLALTRLLRQCDVGVVVRLFYWLTVGHAIIALAPFVAAGGTVRAFGLASLAFDDLAMLSLPIGIILMLYARRGHAAWYALGTIILLGGLVATQSRASIMLAAFGAVAASLVGLWQAKRRVYTAVESSRASVRFSLGLVAILVAAALAIALRPDLFTTLVERFQQLQAPIAVGTLRSRLELWKTALIAFQSDPITGIGPGAFRYADLWFPTLHLSSMYIWVKGLSAHNLMLHSLAETGVIGAAAVLALFINQFRRGWQCLRAERDADRFGTTLALTVASFMFLVTALLEAGWIWGQFTFTFVLFLALIGETLRRLRR